MRTAGERSASTSDTARVLAVLIHGAYTSPWHWHPLVPHLEEAGCEVVVPELPCDDPELGLEGYVQAVEAALAGGRGSPWWSARRSAR